MTPVPPETELKRANRIMVFAVISTIFVLISVVLVIYVLGVLIGQLGRIQEKDPFNVLTRPVPNVQRAAQLFPENLSPFTRAAFAGTLDSFSAKYTNGADVVQIRGSRAVSLVAAQTQVFQLAEQLGLASRGQLLDSAKIDGAYYFNVGRQESRLIYSRQRWFFDIQATSETALNAFMSVFPY